MKTTLKFDASILSVFDWKSGRGYVVMSRQGCSLNEHEVKRILTLLANTDMTIFEIAQRMTCSRGTIAAIKNSTRYCRRKTHCGPGARPLIFDNIMFKLSLVAFLAGVAAACSAKEPPPGAIRVP